MRKIVVQRAEGIGPGRLAGLGEALLDRVEADPGGGARLAMLGLAGDGVLLGRHQRARSALALPRVDERGLEVARRLGGGRAIRAGAGTAAILLAVPSTAFLPAVPAPTERFVNRHVRGLVAGLTAVAGAPVGWFGRDFLSSRNRQVAVVSWEARPSGAALLEAVVGIDRPLALPAELDGYPPHGDPRAGGPPHVALAEVAAAAGAPEVSLARVADAMVRGHEEAHAAACEEGGDLPEARPSPGPAVLEDETGLSTSGVGEVPIGFVEALVAAGDGRIEAARLRGDFLAPAFAIRALEERLRGAPLAFEALGRLVDEAFRAPGVAILGVRHLRIFADALLAAGAEG